MLPEPSASTTFSQDTDNLTAHILTRERTDTLRRNRLSPELMEALQILKYYYKQELLCFSSQLLAHEEDYTIEGPVTEAAVDELLKTGQIHVLEDLLRNSRESEASTLDHTSIVFD